MSTADQLRRELHDGWLLLRSYGKHAPGCPAIWGAGGGGCDCGLEAARIRFQRAAWQQLSYFGAHLGDCPAPGGACTCGLDAAKEQILSGVPDDPDAGATASPRG